MPQKVLLISPVPSHPQNAGNRARINSLLLSLQQLGHEVHFIHIQESSGDIAAMRQAWGGRFYSIPYQPPATRQKVFSRRLDQLLLRKLQAILGNDPRYNYPIDSWYDDSTNPILKDLATSINPDVVIVEYVFFSKALECFDSNILKIIDTHDIFADRYKLYLRKGQPPQWFSTSREQENKGLKRANCIIAIQQHEAAYFSKQFSHHQHVITVGHLVPLLFLQRPVKHHTLLFLASKNPINVHALNYFFNDIFPLAKARDPNLKLLLAGEICTAVEDREDCLKLGTIDELHTAYAQADIVINPIQFGTGLKVKNIEALGFGKPLVTTSTGAFGLESGIGQAYLVADDPEQFAAAILSLLTDSQLYRQLSQQAYEFAVGWNAACLENLSSLLEQTEQKKSDSPRPLFPIKLRL